MEQHTFPGTGNAFDGLQHVWKRKLAYQRTVQIPLTFRIFELSMFVVPQIVACELLLIARVIRLDA